jgi:ERCC4-type nuclease
MFDYCERVEKVPWLIVTGLIEDVEAQFKERKQVLNRQAIYGALASVSVRYAVHIIWSERPFKEVLEIMKSICEKVHEGKLNQPIRRKLKEFSRWRSVATVANSLQVSSKIADSLVKKFGGLYGILEAIKHRPGEVLIMEGIGQSTFNKMKVLGGVS